MRFRKISFTFARDVIPLAWFLPSMRLRWPSASADDRPGTRRSDRKGNRRNRAAGACRVRLGWIETLFRVLTKAQGGGWMLYAQCPRHHGHPREGDLLPARPARLEHRNRTSSRVCPYRSVGDPCGSTTPRRAAIRCAGLCRAACGAVGPRARQVPRERTSQRPAAVPRRSTSDGPDGCAVRPRRARRW